MARWAHVTLTPEDNKITVFNNGKPNGSKVWIPTGGNWHPALTAGVKALWKKAQKKLTKKKISETINKIIPARKPVLTLDVCCLSILASLTMSINQPATPQISIGNHQMVAKWLDHNLINSISILSAGELNQYLIGVVSWNLLAIKYNKPKVPNAENIG